jgi:hypothetical protein
VISGERAHEALSQLAAELLLEAIIDGRTGLA